MADLLDVISLAEARTALALDTGHSALLEQTITAISRRLDKIVGPIVQRTITDELHDAAGPLIFLDYTPVMSVTTVTEYLSGTGTVLSAEDIDTSGDYLLRDGILSRRSGFYTTSWNGRIKVTYEAGRYATTAAVDNRFKTAASAILRRWWAREAPAWARGGDPFAVEGAGGIGFFKVIDPVVDEFLADQRRAPAIA